MLDDLLDGWPAAASAVVVRLVDGRAEPIATAGEMTVVREWASVSKMVVAWAAALAVDRGERRYEDVVESSGATLAHLLAHASGLGAEETDPVRAVGTRRIYSNVGVDRAFAHVSGGTPAAEWLAERIFVPWGLTSCELRGRPSSGVRGSTEDMARLAVAWLRADGFSTATRDRVLQPFLPELTGIVPGFGRFTPCAWGLGPELRDSKQHWMGAWPASSFGHFGQSGALVLANCDLGVAVVATSDAPFGPWAVELWPRWTSRIYRAVTTS